MERVATSTGQGGKAGGKGPKGGCHECGGDHFARDCAIRAQRKGGKGKGKDWSSVPAKPWANWNPGFMPTQWGKWRPGGPQNGKGTGFGQKSYGKGGVNLTGAGGDVVNWGDQVDLSKLQFPALASVTPAANDWSQGDALQWDGSSADGLKWIEVVAKKPKRTYKKLESVVDDLHKGMTYEGKNRFEALSDKGVETEKVEVKRKEKMRFCVSYGDFVDKCEDKCCSSGRGSEKHASLVGREADDPSIARRRKEDKKRVSSGESHLVGQRADDPNVADKMPEIFTDPIEGEELEERKCSRKVQFFRKVKPVKSIAPVEAKGKNGGWTCMSIAVDSGACDNVIGPQSVPQYRSHIKETADSLKGEGFVSATGEAIPNYGELVLPIITRERHLKSITFQAAGVAKPLLSAEKLNEAGQVVIFDGDNSCIVNRYTGEVMALRREEGNFMLDVWIPPASLSEELGFHGQP